ncbi:hypothetical protein AMTRI_Chr11g99060 [Amborella trichopoda]
MSFLLQRDGVNPVPFSHAPFHLSGTADNPWSEKLSLSGQIPVSMIPTMTSRPKEATGQIPFFFLRPRNRGVWVVKSLAYASRRVARWPGSCSSWANWARESGPPRPTLMPAWTCAIPHERKMNWACGNCPRE